MGGRCDTALRGILVCIGGHLELSARLNFTILKSWESEGCSGLME